MYGASDSLADNLQNTEFQSPTQKYSTFLSLMQKARNYSKALTFWEMHSLAALLPDWIHHLSYSQVQETLESFTQGRFIAFLQKGYKEAFGEVCRQAYLHGMLYHMLEDVTLDEESALVIKDEVKAEVLESNKPYFFAKLFGVKSELNIQIDRESTAKNTQNLDSIVAEAVIEAACKKMSHPVDDLKNHEEIYSLAKRAIIHCLQKCADGKALKLVIPQPKGHGHGLSCDVNFVYDMASFIISNEKRSL